MDKKSVTNYLIIHVQQPFLVPSVSSASEMHGHFEKIKMKIVCENQRFNDTCTRVAYSKF